MAEQPAVLTLPGVTEVARVWVKPEGANTHTYSAISNKKMNKQNRGGNDKYNKPNVKN